MDQRRLRSDRGAAAENTLDRRFDQRRLQLAQVREVGHEREVLARVHHLLEQAERGVRVRVGGETLRPVGQSLGADPDRLQLLQLEQRLDISPDDGLAHDHGVAAGDQDAGHLGMPAKVAHHLADVVGGELQVRVTDELRPSEAVGAVGVTGLPLFGEDQRGFVIFVLHARHRLLVHLRDVELLLTCRVRVELRAYAVRFGLDLGVGRFGLQQIGQPGDVSSGKHVLLREDELVDGVVGRCRPIYEFIHDIGVRPEGQHRRHGADLQPLLVIEPRSLQELVEVLGRVRLEASCASLVQDH
jgi:hypothetical protein